RMALLLELPLMLRFFTKRLRVAHLEDYAGRRFGLRARAVPDCDPALCYDVDTLDDYAYAVKRLGRPA
ncbi:MAG TPA: hypothetical protein VGD50_08405, partial [Candidatus Baltobacteraceae bacterium]